MLFAGILFFLLSPGVLLTIPAGSRGLFASGQTSVLAAAIHAAVFVAALYLLTGVVTEGFFGYGCTTGNCDRGNIYALQGQSCDSKAANGGSGGCGICVLNAEVPGTPRNMRCDPTTPRSGNNQWAFGGTTNAKNADGVKPDWLKNLEARPGGFWHN